MSDQGVAAVHGPGELCFGEEVHSHKYIDNQSGDGGSPTLWPARDTVFKGGAKPEIRKRGVEDLYSLYENMGSTTDLTFKDMCGYLPQRKEEKVKPVEPPAATVDFTEGLAAVQSALSNHVLSEPEQNLQKPEPTQQAQIPTNLSPKSGNERVHPSMHFFMKNDSVGGRNGLTRDESESYRRSISSDSGATYGDGRNAVMLKEFIDKQEPAKRNGNTKQTGGGVPHSNYCCICNRYALFLKTRCLVCGKCYCTQCVKVGMGNMPEGRKCRSCLGRRFSERYIERAGKAWFSISSEARMAEIKWAKKGTHKRDVSVSKSARVPHHFVAQRTPQRTPPRSPLRSPHRTPPRSPLRAYPSQNMDYAFL